MHTKLPLSLAPKKSPSPFDTNNLFTSPDINIFRSCRRRNRFDGGGGLTLCILLVLTIIMMIVIRINIDELWQGFRLRHLRQVSGCALTVGSPPTSCWRPAPWRGSRAAAKRTCFFECVSSVFFRTCVSRTRSAAAAARSRM